MSMRKSVKKPATRKATRQKRGIVLLIVVSLLALFVLMGVAFAIVAMHYKNTADLSPQIERYGDPSQREFELVLDQILFDTRARSSLQGQSLLEDFYGTDGHDGYLTSVAVNLDSPPGLNLAATPQQQPQVWQFTAAGTSVPFSVTPGYYAGRVMTFTMGDAAGHSTRVLDSAYDANSGQWAFAVEAIESKGPTNLRPNYAAASPQNSRFIINGAPFNGTGAGYAGGSISATYAGPDGSGGYLTPNLIALLPHFMGYDPAGSMPVNPNAGCMDESWDAPDFQNMYLAMVPPIAAITPNTPIIPSYHRPELVNYWRNNVPTEFQGGPLDAFDPTNANPPVAAQLRNFLRTFIFRPMPWEHPNFNGGNGAFDLGLVRQQAIVNLTNNGQPTTEPGLSQEVTKILLDNLVNAGNAPIWDVDNDNDGIPESIWIDPGLPVVTRPDGRRYKRLVAICIKDLDGRINLNAHGNGAQVATQGGNYIYRAEYQVPAGFGVMSANSYIPRGVGFGPAEVDFLHVFGNSGNAGAVTAYTNLLQARYASNWTAPAVDNGGTAAPGIPTQAEPLSMVQHQGIPNSYGALTPPFLSWYASPPDVWGRGAIVLDYGGQPRTTGMGMVGEMIDQPYELSLSGEENGTDSPYTLVELERMLRYNDADVGIPYGDPAALAAHSRPLGLASNWLASSPPGSVGPDEALRNLFTTHSSYVPSPASTIPRESRGSMILGAATILDLYYSKLVNAGLTEPTLSNEFRKLVPWELMHGRKFDLNRWLGDGWDSNGDNTPDDYGEAFAGENGWQAPPAFTGVAAQHSNGMDVNSDGSIDGVDRFLARQLYARHLHCLALAMIPSGFNPQIPNEGMTAGQEMELVTRRLAQWAINCVDFRDADSIMTAYEYDLNPWDGWQVDGNPATDGSVGNEEIINGSPVATNMRRLVWGVEYPDLLITETYSLHDRRVKDTNQDGTNPRDRNDTPTNDDDVDQFRVPQGSVYLELYCPRNSVGRNPMLPRELYDYSVAANPRLQLGRLAPGGRPVWRMALSRIIGPGETAQQQVHPATMAGTNPESASYDPFGVNLLPGGTPATAVAIERFAYFGNAAPALTAAERNFSFYNTFSNPLVEPGQYVVVGPRQRTYLGSQNPNTAVPMPAMAGTLWGGNSRQYIDLNAGGITIVDTENPANTTTLTPGTDIRPAIPVICDMPGVTPTSGGAPWTQACPWNIGLNISEPLPSGNYYPQPLLTNTPAGATQADFYDDPDMPTPAFLDTPVEKPTVPANAGRPIADHGMTESGPYNDCSSVFLQRLANPNLAYNPAPGGDPYVAFNPALPVNPYISVDWASLDLNVFSGEEDSDRTVMGGPDDGNPIDPDDDPNNQPNGGVPTGTRQRGYRPTPPVADSNFWNPVTANPGDLPQATSPAGSYFIYNLARFGVDGQTRHTLGYVNGPVGTPIGPAPNANLGEPNLTATGQTAPWLTFHNRPFASPMELLLVPSSSAGRLCSELTPGPLSASVSSSPYDASNPQTLRAPFGHLLNPFHTADQGTNPTAASQLARLLDYVEVPSPYQGAERWFTPAHFAGPYAPPTNPLATYRPPFNKASRFRDPGRININTIFDERIWQAAIANSPLQARGGAGIFWNTNAFYGKLIESRQGYGIGPYAMSPNHGTRFANPFRSADASDLMPDPNGAGGPDDMRKNRPVDATFLRPDPNTPDEPLFAVRSTQGYDNTERNPYFRYQGYQKIGNVFSTTSNVFAVWMTMGYFEVEDNLNAAGARVVDAGHPEGIRLGQEVGIDSGEIVRHRSFFIIDRSVPVGFAAGQKLNTDDCILLRRFIE